VSSEHVVNGVCRKQLHQRLLCVKSTAESAEIVEKLKTLEQEISARKSSQRAKQMQEGEQPETGTAAAWMFFETAKIAHIFTAPCCRNFRGTEHGCSDWLTKKRNAQNCTQTM